MLAFPAGVLAQGTPLYFSPVSGDFSRLPPIGAAFDITFTKPITNTKDTLVGVQLESFGFVNELDSTLQRMLNAGDPAANCRVIRQAQQLYKAHPGQILHQKLGRQVAADQAAVSLTHPQLYYRRAYLFGITYYYKATTQRLQQAVMQAISPLIENVLQRQIAQLPGWRQFPPTNREAFYAQTKQIIDNVLIAERLRQVLPDDACTEGFILRNGFPALKLSEIVSPDEVMIFFTEYLSKRAVQQDLERLLSRFDNAVLQLRASPTATIRTQVNAFVAVDTLSAFAPGTGGMFQALRKLSDLSPADIKYLDRAVASASALQGRALEYANIKQYFRLTASGASQGTVSKAAALAAASARYLRLPTTIAVASVGESTLFVQTLRERLPYYISVDGGVAYAFRFKQAMPTASLNIKFWPGDMDDPQIRWEPSLLVGLGFRVPDDEAAFKGFFGDESTHALLLGLGIRNNKVAGGAVRLTVGSMLYRVKDTPATSPSGGVPASQVKSAPYVGLSLNSEILGWVGEKFKSVKGILP